MNKTILTFSILILIGIFACSPVPEETPVTGDYQIEATHSPSANSGEELYSTLEPTSTAGLISPSATPTPLSFTSQPELTPTPEPVDIKPPVLKYLYVISANQIEIEFDEPVIANKEQLVISPELEVTMVELSGNRLVVYTMDQTPGTSYSIQSYISDYASNSSDHLCLFYGFNPMVPSVFINEFITNGIDTHPDLVELKVLSSGNMAGLVLYAGVQPSYYNQFVFPDLKVAAGEFILVHFKPQGLAVEVNETTAKDQSGGLDSSVNAWDFWVQNGSGIYNSIGVLSLYTNPTGTMIDGVFYSNRTSSSDVSYDGFGSKEVKATAFELARCGEWLTSTECITPQDGFNPELSTSTRSICRNPSAPDTNSKEDWHIVPTRKASFGLENSTEIYIAP